MAETHCRSWHGVLRTRSMPTRHGSLHFPPQRQPRLQRAPTTSVSTRKRSAETTSPKFCTAWTVSRTGGCLLFGKCVFCRNFAAYFRCAPLKSSRRSYISFENFFSSSVQFLSAPSFDKTGNFVTLSSTPFILAAVGPAPALRVIFSVASWSWAQGSYGVFIYIVTFKGHEAPKFTVSSSYYKFSKFFKPRHGFISW